MRAQWRAPILPAFRMNMARWPTSRPRYAFLYATIIGRRARVVPHAGAALFSTNSPFRFRGETTRPFQFVRQLPAEPTCTYFLTNSSISALYFNLSMHFPTDPSLFSCSLGFYSHTLPSSGYWARGHVAEAFLPSFKILVLVQASSSVSGVSKRGAPNSCSISRLLCDFRLLSCKILK